MDPDTNAVPEPNDRGADPQVRRTRYQEAFEFAPDCQLVTDRRGVILEANHAAAALAGCRKSFLIGKPLALFAVEGARARFYECLSRLTRGAPTDAFESRLTRRGGGPRAVHVVARAGEPAPGAGAPDTIHWLVRDVTEWLRAEADRADLQRRLTTAQEDERRRVARDLHDTTGQLLTALALGIRAVRDAGPLTEAARARLDHVQGLTDELARQVHGLAGRLRPTALDDLGLEAAVRQLVADWSARTGVGAEFQAVGPLDPRFPPEVETVLFRVVQEALTNVARHAGAGRVAVVLGQSDGHAVAVVEDDGAGFEPGNGTPAAGPSGENCVRLGLLGMRERVALAGGTLGIESTPGRGTTVLARVPIGPRPAE